MAELRCLTCGGSFETGLEFASLSNPTAEDFQTVADANAAHVATHPDSLKTDMAPAPVKRDWVGDR